MLDNRQLHTQDQALSKQENEAERRKNKVLVTNPRGMTKSKKKNSCIELTHFTVTLQRNKTNQETEGRHVKSKPYYSSV